MKKNTLETATIVLPLPPACLSPNNPPGSRGGRMKKAAAVKKYRRQAKEATAALEIEGGWELATVKATFYHKQKRRRDDVNHLAMLKPAYDGIVDAGLLVDDDSDHLKTLPPIFEIDRRCPRVELLVTYGEPDA
ncbi:hypothetical protein [Cerasicoccus frondis]|uniref:hypothetical protein n=1 Tax=Cerasicoccus frondis TaxID=490090 RepID=UPI002852729E|nr:hypothetical protein [Cerasicoccus frondis]